MTDSDSAMHIWKAGTTWPNFENMMLMSTVKYRNHRFHLSEIFGIGTSMETEAEP